MKKNVKKCDYFLFAYEGIIPKYNEYENLYSDFKLINNNQLKISYGIYDTSQEINIGIIDLISLEYKNNKN